MLVCPFQIAARSRTAGLLWFLSLHPNVLKFWRHVNQALGTCIRKKICNTPNTPESVAQNQRSEFRLMVGFPLHMAGNKMWMDQKGLWKSVTWFILVFPFGKGKAMKPTRESFSVVSCACRSSATGYLIYLPGLGYFFFFLILASHSFISLWFGSNQSLQSCTFQLSFLQICNAGIEESPGHFF